MQFINTDIPKKHPDLTVGKRYFLDAMRNVSYSLVKITDEWLVFKYKEGKKQDGELDYREHEDGTVRFAINEDLTFYEII